MRSPPRSARASITCWSTNTRTPTALQAAILLALKPDGRGLTVVGDDAQSIYSFRAATVRNILDFPGHFKPPARVVTLEQNYRSTQPILAAVQRRDRRSRAERFTKNLWSRARSRPSARSWSRCATRPIRRATSSSACWRTARPGCALKSQAVLFRASHHSATLEIELTRRNIPFVKFGGLKFLEAAHVKDVLAALRLAENPRDRVAGFRVAQLVPGIGPASAARSPRRGSPRRDPAATRWRRSRRRARGAGLAGLRRRCSTRCSRTAPAGRPSSSGAALVRAASRAPARRCGTCARPISSSSSRSPRAIRTRERFLTELTLDPPDATSDEAGAPLLDEDYLILSTIHSAKGQEWKAVFVLNAVDGCIPSDLATGTRDEIEEERRLLYVAMTRAKDQLDVIVPQRFYTHNQANRGDRYVYALRTRFIPSSVAKYFEQRVWPSAQASAASAQSQAQMDVTARMRAMWR